MAWHGMMGKRNLTDHAVVGSPFFLYLCLRTTTPFSIVDRPLSLFSVLSSSPSSCFDRVLVLYSVSVFRVLCVLFGRMSDWPTFIYFFLWLSLCCRVLLIVRGSNNLPSGPCFGLFGHGVYVWDLGRVYSGFVQRYGLWFPFVRLQGYRDMVI